MAYYASSTLLFVTKSFLAGNFIEKYGKFGIQACSPNAKGTVKRSKTLVLCLTNCHLFGVYSSLLCFLRNSRVLSSQVFTSLRIDMTFMLHPQFARLRREHKRGQGNLHLKEITPRVSRGISLAGEPCCKRYTMESYWTWTKIRLSYLANNAVLCGVVLEWDKKFIYLSRLL